MKTRTKMFLNIFMIFWCIGIVVSLTNLAGPIWHRIGQLIFSIVLLISAYITKQGSKFGWWVLTVFFGLGVAGTFVGVIALSMPGEDRIALLSFGGLIAIFLFLMLTDSPWKWKESESDAISNGQNKD